MAQPARRPRATEAPPIDPGAVARAYRHERAKRRARLERSRERRIAGFRFVAVLAGLVVLGLFLLLTIWEQVERLFGL